MQRLLSSTEVEKSIKSKLGKPMSKQQLSLALGYLTFKYEKYMMENDDINASVYLNFMDVVQKNYNKFKDIDKKPFVLDESKRIEYLDK